MKLDWLGVARQMLRRYGERAQRPPAAVRQPRTCTAVVRAIAGSLRIARVTAEPSVGGALCRVPVQPGGPAPPAGPPGCRPRDGDAWPAVAQIQVHLGRNRKLLPAQGL